MIQTLFSKQVQVELRIVKSEPRYFMCELAIDYKAIDRLAEELGFCHMQFCDHDYTYPLRVLRTKEEHRFLPATEEEVRRFEEYFRKVEEAGQTITVYNRSECRGYGDHVEMAKSGIRFIKDYNYFAHFYMGDKLLQSHLPFPRGVYGESPFYPTCESWAKLLPEYLSEEDEKHFQ